MHVRSGLVDGKTMQDKLSLNMSLQFSMNDPASE